MRHASLISISALLLALAACTPHRTVQEKLDFIVGNDRDEHGCLSSAGYTWSYALHDCVRVWEVGERYANGNHTAYLIMSPDSTFAEIFPEGKSQIVCKRVKGQNLWRQRKTHESVTLDKGGITLHLGSLDYKKE